MSTLLRDAIATKLRNGMTVENIYDTYGIDLRAIGRRPEPRRARQPWTYEMATSAAEMWERGCTVSHIAETIGVSYRAMQMWAQRHRDLCPQRGGTPPWSDERRAVIAEMWREGKPITEIADAIGVKHTILRSWASHHRDICPSRFKVRKKEQ